MSIDGGRFYWERNLNEKVKEIVIIFAWILIEESELKNHVHLYASLGWNSLVAIKIVRGMKKYRDGAMIEVEMLQQLGKHDSCGNQDALEHYTTELMKLAMKIVYKMAKALRMQAEDMNALFKEAVQMIGHVTVGTLTVTPTSNEFHPQKARDDEPFHLIFNFIKIEVALGNFSEICSYPLLYQWFNDVFSTDISDRCENILSRLSESMDTIGEVVPLDETSTNHLKTTIDQFASEPLRTLCLGYNIELEKGFSPATDIPVFGYTCIGIVGIKDPIRLSVREFVVLCHSAGVNVQMVTGDNINTATAIARESITCFQTANQSLISVMTLLKLFLTSG
ncbi:hypothetical protein FXO38_08443 [Capsicum annuum]|nr:hypothetical protein FXO38_08443 [Capsicum annuum]